MVSRQELESLFRIQNDAFQGNIQNVISIFESKVSKLEDSVSQAKAEIVELKQRNSELQAEICELKESSPTAPPPVADVSELHAKLNDLEDRSRRNNLKFEGVAEGPNENWEQSTEKILKIISDKLQISEPVEIERAHRIGKPSADRSRPIIARFLRHQDREKILKNPIN